MWIDWACVPQYSGDPMPEIVRSRLYYARAQDLLILPTVNPLSEEQIVKVVLEMARCVGLRTIRSSALSSALFPGRAWKQ